MSSDFSETGVRTMSFLMGIDSILLLILALFVVMGVWRGGISAGAALFTLLFAYGGGVISASRGGSLVTETMGTSAVFAAPVAGTLGFLIAFMIAAILAGFARRWDRERCEESGRSGLDRALGGIFGGLRGALVVLLLSYLSIWLDAARDLGVMEAVVPIPDVEGSRFAHVTERVVARAVEAGLEAEDGEVSSEGRVIARVASNPGTALRGIQEVLDDPRIGDLQRDGLFWALVENGSSESALNRMSFLQISHDDAMRARLADLGLVSRSAVEDVDLFRDEAMAVLDQVGPRLKGLSEDPELQQLAQNPEIMGLVESGDTLALLRRPEIQRLVERISSTP